MCEVIRVRYGRGNLPRTKLQPANPIKRHTEADTTRETNPTPTLGRPLCTSRWSKLMNL